MSLAAILVGGAVAAFFALRRGAHEVSLNDARRRFEQNSSTLPQQAHVLRPRAGVYAYVGSGNEHLSFPPKDQKQGPRMPGTVTHHANGCWTLRIDYSSNHWQTFDYCPRGQGLAETGGKTFERFDFVATKVDTIATITCKPEAPIVLAGLHAGQVWQQRCTGTNSAISGSLTTAGPYTFIGEESVDVGGSAVPAYHFRQERTLTGAQTGNQRVDFWFATDTGMPLRNERKYTVHSDSPIGTVTFTETGEFHLTSLTPQT
ncbi:MAG TPA: hypothetical protein VFR41_06285 [Acidimicrobiia bacterium]|nr:hypothetical protein [Acidimicrobiia bacterium]